MALNSNREFDGQWLSRNQLQGVQIDTPQQAYDVQQAYQVLVPQRGPTPDATTPGNAQINDSIGFQNPTDRAREQRENDEDVAQRYKLPGENKPEGNFDIGGDDPFGKDGVAKRGQERQDGQLASEEESGLGSSLSSLDIELPARGVDFYFKSPRGKATVIARPLETRSFSRWMSVGISIGVCVGVVVACWILSWISRKPFLRRSAIVGVLFIGLVSLVSWFLPIYGFIALLGAAILLIHGAINSMFQNSTPETAR